MATLTSSPTALGTNAWTNPTYAYSSNDQRATATPGKSTDIAGIWKTFGITDPAPTSTITKVEVGCEWSVDTDLSIFTLRMRASYDAGSNWTNYVDDTNEQTSEALVWYDVTDGHSWTWSELSDTYFQVDVTASQGNSKTAVTCSLDHVQVRITYSPPTTPCEVYAAEAILSYEVPPAEVYAAEAILDYTAPTEVYAAEAILNYEVNPAEVYAAEAILDYIAPTEVYAAEAILDYLAATEVYAAEVILDYEVPPAEVYAAEAILDYEVPPAEVYAAEAILDYEVPPAEVYAAEAVLDYEVNPAEVYAVEAILDYELLATGGGSPGRFAWPIARARKTPDELRERRAKKKLTIVSITDNVELTDEAIVSYKGCVLSDDMYVSDRLALEKRMTLTDDIEAVDSSALTHKHITFQDDMQTHDNLSIFATIPIRPDIMRERSLEKVETMRAYARRGRKSPLGVLLSRSNDPSKTRKLERQYASELDGLFLDFKKGMAKLLNRRELADDWDEYDPEELYDKFNRVIEVTITIPGTGIVRKFTTRAYTAGGLRSSQFLNSLGIKAVFSILPTDQAALDIMVTRDLGGLKGITDEMAKQIVQELTDGMLRGDSIATVARAIDDRVDSIGRARATTLARTEIMKAFNEGAQVQYDKHGIEKVEWLTAPNDGRLCDECIALGEGGPYPIDDHPDIPAHPQCRCILLPVIPEIE